MLLGQLFYGFYRSGNRFHIKKIISVIILNDTVHLLLGCNSNKVPKEELVDVHILEVSAVFSIMEDVKRAGMIGQNFIHVDSNSHYLILPVK